MSNLCLSCSNFGLGFHGYCAKGTVRTSSTCGDYIRVERCATCCHRSSAAHTYCSDERRNNDAFCRFWAHGPALPPPKPLTPYEKLCADPDARLEHIYVRLREFEDALDKSTDPMIDQFRSGYYVHHTQVHWMADELTRLRETKGK